MMFKNYFFISLRNIKKSKVFSIVNILGLSVAISVCVLISLYINEDLSYDKFHKNYNNIYRVNQLFKKDGNNVIWSLTPSGFAKAFENEFAGVQAVRLSTTELYKPVIKFNNRLLTASDFIFTDPSFFKIFDYELIQGDINTVLDEPFSIVLSQTEAHRIFGDVNPMGNVIRINNLFDYKVTGIVKDPPGNSTIQFKYLAPMNNVKDVFRKEYGWNMSDDDILNNFNAANFYTFILIAENHNQQQINNQLPNFLSKYCGEQTSSNSNLILQPLSDIHYGTGLQFDFANRGNLSNNYILAAIAFFILFIACINFINISTAQSSQRAKEIGLRKVLGAFRGKIIWQFITEYSILTFISVLFSILLVAFSLPFFNELTNKELTLNPFINTETIFIFITVWLVVVMITCLYPAFYLSSFQPAVTLKKSFAGGSKKSLLKKSLIVLQFGISIFLIVVTFTVFQQHSFMKSHNLGFDKEQVLFLPHNIEISKNYDAFKNQLLQRADIKYVSRSNWVPSNPHNIEQYSWASNSGRASDGFYSLIVEDNYAQTLGFEFASGRNFSKEFSLDKDASYIINETAAKKMGWKPEEAVGKFINSYTHGNRQIVGVIKDFNFTSLHQKVDPIVMFIGEPSQLYVVIVKINSSSINQTLSSINSIWKNLAPNFPFDYHFLDNDFENLYRTEEKLSKIITLFSVISIIITCLGLLGLVINSTQERIKEVGIRKVLGASVNRIVYLLIKEYITLIFIASILSFPIAYFFTKDWLQNFAYRIDISLWIFLFAGLLTLFIALTTVIFQAIKVATTNPIESLRYE